MPVVPHRFLFRYSMPVPHVEPRRWRCAVSRLGRRALSSRSFGALDEAPSFAKIQAGWNEAGIGFRVSVSGKKMPVAEVADEPRESDGLQIWLDTRNTQTIHRASRFCHHFAFLPSSPSSGGRRGAKNGAGSAYQFAIALAKEDAPSTRAGLLRADVAIAGRRIRTRRLDPGGVSGRLRTGGQSPARLLLRGPRRRIGRAVSDSRPRVSVRPRPQPLVDTGTDAVWRFRRELSACRTERRPRILQEIASSVADSWPRFWRMVSHVRLNAARSSAFSPSTARFRTA